MIFIILASAFILRIITLNQSLWLDEAINVNVASSLSFYDLFFKYSLSDFHPPLYHLILKSWIIPFGNSEVLVRLPSVLFGTLTVLVTFLIGKKLFDKKTAYIAATLIATSPLAIYYSQEARMYALAALFASLSVYFYVSILSKDRMVYWIGFILATAVMLYTDYLPYLLLPTYAFHLYFLRKKIPDNTLKSFLPAFIIIFILLIPWLLIFPKQMEVGLSASAASPAWAEVVGSGDFKNLAITFVKMIIGRISVENNFIYAFVFAPIGLFIVFLFPLSFFRISYIRSILWFWFFLPIFLGFVISFLVPVFSYFRFVFVLSAFYLILASAINTINWVRLVRSLLLVVLAINLTCLFIYFSNPKFQREDWKSAVMFVQENSSTKTIILFESDQSVAPFDYYNKKNLRTMGALDNFNADSEKIKKKLENLSRNFDKIYLFQYLSGITDPQGLVFQELNNQSFVNTATHNFNGVGFIYEFRHY